jgi:cytoskeletal protein CcmA (bactofilin family)
MLKRERQIQGIESLISQGVEIKGQIFAQGSMRIDGKIDGQIEIKGDLLIGEKGQVKGGVKAENIILGGKIEGDVQARGRFELTSTGAIKGDVACATITVEEGGLLDGNFKMIQNNPDTRLVRENDTKSTKAESQKR